MDEEMLDDGEDNAKKVCEMEHGNKSLPWHIDYAENL
jgi:hypothetical protein